MYLFNENYAHDLDSIKMLLFKNFKLFQIENFYLSL